MASNTCLAVFALLVCGSMNTVTTKISFTLYSENSFGEVAIFSKPWFSTFVMFVAMALALMFDRSICQKSSSLHAHLIDAEGGGGSPKNMSWSKKVCMVAIPAVFDILATGMCSMGFLYIPASVWQLLRGAEMIFAAIFAVLFLGQKLYLFHWLGIALCTGGIVLVGFASVWGADFGAAQDDGPAADVNAASGIMLLGIALTLGGQVVQAAQIIAEEWLLKDVDLPGVQIIGFEGFWGALIMLVVAFPALYYLPGADHGHQEDEMDAFVMVCNNKTLLLNMAVYTFSCVTYNMAGIAVTGALSAVHRTMLEAFRTCIVWVFGLSVHYFYDSQSKFGEAWTPYSYLEVIGFVFLMFGQGIYGRMLTVPGLKYPKETPNVQQMVTPGRIRVLNTPLPSM